MKVNEFIQKFKEDKVQNTKMAPNAVSDYLKNELEIKTYIPFRDKRAIVETVVERNIEWVDGFKKCDTINQYVSFVTAMLKAHTNLELSQDPVEDYDLLAESGLLPLIIEEFRASYNESDLLLKMALAAELEDNNLNAIVARFTQSILDKLDGVGEALKTTIGNVDINSILGGQFKEEDLAKLSGFLDTIK